MIENYEHALRKAKEIEIQCNSHGHETLTEAEEVVLFLVDKIKMLESTLRIADERDAKMVEKLKDLEENHINIPKSGEARSHDVEWDAEMFKRDYDASERRDYQSPIIYEGPFEKPLDEGFGAL